MREGKGKFFDKDGKCYFGEYVKDKKEGIGKYNWGGKVYLGFWKLNKQNGLGKFKGFNKNNYIFGIWVDGKRTEWVDEEALKKENNKYFNDYQQILKFNTNFNEDDFNEKNIVKDI